MRRLLSITGLVIGMLTVAFAQNKQDMENIMSKHKALVVYFSATGTTEQVAGVLASVTDGKLEAILPAEPYTAADLDWHDKDSRSSVEMRDAGSRPAIRNQKVDMSAYDIIFIGYPIWWDLAPRVVNTFIEQNSLLGKVMVPFATSGGSGISNSVANLKSLYPELDWKEGRLLNRADEKSVRAWINKLKL